MEQPELYLASRRVLSGTAALTVAVAVAAVLAVRAVAVRMLHPSPVYTPLSLESPIIATVVCTLIATYVFAGMATYPNPVRTWRRTSAVVLMLSFVPCGLLALSRVMGGGWPEAFALMTMHVAVWAICATLLPRLALTKHPRQTEGADRPLSIR